MDCVGSSGFLAVRAENLNSDVAVMQSAQDSK
jgi:hypothetical protein